MIQEMKVSAGDQILGKVSARALGFSPNAARQTFGAHPNPPPNFPEKDTTVVDSDGNFVHTIVRDDGSISITVTSPGGKLLSLTEEDKDGNVISRTDYTMASWVWVLLAVAAVYLIFIHKW